MTSYNHELFVADKGMAEIEAKIVAQGDKIRELKAAKAAKDAIQPEVNISSMFCPHAFIPPMQVAALLALKAEYKAATGEDWKPPAAPAKAAPVKAPSPPKVIHCGLRLFEISFIFQI